MTQDIDPTVEAEHDRLWKQTVETLTAVARLDRFDRDGEAEDFAAFLAFALRATVANLGGLERLQERMQPSWEAEKLNELLNECAGYDPQDLIGYRTERVVVPLNVEDLVDEAWQGGQRSESLLPYGEADLVAGDDDEQRAAVYHRYVDGYRAYAERFVAAVYSAAWDTPGLTSDQVSVIVETDPDYQPVDSVTNPNDFEADWLVRHLWSRAFAAVGMPTVPTDGAEM